MYCSGFILGKTNGAIALKNLRIKISIKTAVTGLLFFVMTPCSTEWVLCL